jgi:transposase
MPKTNVRSRRVFRKGHGVAAEQPSLAVFLDDRLDVDHEVRRLKDLVEKVLGPELRERCSMEGGYDYDPVGILCVWLYGFLKGINASRPLAECCRYDLRFEYLCSSCRPDYTTLSRFRADVGADMDSMLARVSLAAEELGILKRRCISADGTKVPASESQWKRVRKEADDAEACEDGPAMMVSHGDIITGYNVQAAVDVDSDFTVGYCLSSSPNDLDQMADLMVAVEAQSGALSESVIADKGYDSSPNAIALGDANVVAYLPAKDHKYTPPFKQDEAGKMRCQAGHIAKEGDWKDLKHGAEYRIFRVSQCTNCPLKDVCPGKGNQRSMKVLKRDVMCLKQAANARCLTDEGKALLKRRSPTVERKFAEFKNRCKFTRFRLRSRAKASIEFGLLVLATNLKLLDSCGQAAIGPFLAPIYRLFAVSNRLVASIWQCCRNLMLDTTLEKVPCNTLVLAAFEL